jgi:DNA repair protein RecO (recombination protein O)
MPVYRDEAVVIRTHKLGEADRIVTMLSRYHGLIRAVAKGVRRTTSKFGSRLEPFMVVDIQLHEGRNLDTVSQVETLNAYGGQIIEDYPSFTAATAMVETAEKLAGGETSPQQYLLLLGGLRALANQEHESGLILDSYLLRALSVAGWAPSFTDCARCGQPGVHRFLVLQAGGMVCEECKVAGAVKLDEESARLLGALLAGDWAFADASSQTARSNASGVVAAYSQWHIERGLKSLQHVERT